MATKPKKNKYEENKEIQLIDSKEQYNEIGQDEPDATGRANIASKTRQNAALVRENTSSIKVDEKNLTKKKTITVPECEPDPTYYDLIKNKKELVEELHNQRGYWRVFLQDHLPNADAYTCTDSDLEALARINSKYQSSHHVRPEDFERIVEVWEVEIGQIVQAEKKKNVATKEDIHKMDLEKGKLMLRDHKDLAQLCKNPHFNSLVEEIHKVEQLDEVLGRKENRDQPSVLAPLLAKLHQAGFQADKKSLLRAASRKQDEDPAERLGKNERQRPGRQSKLA